MPDMSKTEIPQGRERRKDIAFGAAETTEKLIQAAEVNIPGAGQSKGWRDQFAEEVGDLFIDKEEKANIDALTQIPNRRALYIRLDEEVKRANRFNHPLAVVMMDIDGFKKVNDGWGHKTGDVVLQKTAKLLEADIRASDYVGRYGGDEFVIILPETERDKIIKQTERLREKIEQNFKEYDLSACFGLAVLGENCESADAIMQAADEAMYFVKNNGKNGVGFRDSKGQMEILKQTDDSIAPEFGGSPVDVQNSLWSFGANREASITVFGSAYLIERLGSHFNGQKQEFSVDCSPEYNFFAIHPGENYKLNKGQALNTLAAFGQNIIMVGNSMSDWVEPEQGVICAFVNGARINSDIVNKAGYISDKQTIKGVIDILEKIQ